MTNYIVTTRDTDGTIQRTYKTIAGAIKRFEEMAGHSIEAAITERYEFADTIPTVRAIRSIETVSNYGTVVTFARIGEQEPEPAAPVAPVQSVDQRTADLYEAIDACKESMAERMSQYRSECAQFGDAGPGQHPSCWHQESADYLAQLEAELAALLDTPESRATAARARAANTVDDGAFDIPF